VPHVQKQKCAFNVFVDIISEPPLISAFAVQTQGGALAEKLTLNKVTNSEPRRDQNEPLGSLSTHLKKQRNPASQVSKVSHHRERYLIDQFNLMNKLIHLGPK